MLKACVNGARRPYEHPALPVSAAQLARDVAAVAAVGIDAVHLHVKDEHGVDTLDGAALVAVLAAVRRAAPGVPIGVTTGAWTLPDPRARLAVIRSWGGLEQAPDFASVNWHEDGADDVAAALLDMGIGVEAGLFHTAGAHAWLASPHRGGCLRVLLELPDHLDAAAVRQQADELLALVERTPTVQDGTAVVVLHGEGASTWPALAHAAHRNLATRIGLEDVLTMPHGSPAADNTALVLAAQHLLSGSAAPTRS